jgi:hypothetical protein
MEDLARGISIVILYSFLWLGLIYLLMRFASWLFPKIFGGVF